MVTMPEQERVLYSITEVCKLLKVSDDTIRRMIKDKQLEAVKVRGQWRIRKESIDRYLGRSS